MPMTLDELETEALKLDPVERVELAERLLGGADPTPPEEIERLWIAEAERRLAELREGRVQDVPAEEVFARVRARLR